MNGIVAYRFRVSPAIFASLPDKGHQEGGMSDAGEDGPLHLPEPASGGEIFEAYYQRAIVEDALWPGLAQASSYFGFDVAPRRLFYPSRFRPSIVGELHDGIESLRLNDASRTRTLIDHLWRSCGASAMPLDVRMIPYQRPLPDSLPQALPLDPVVQEQLAVWRRAARRRDSLVAALCEALRRGTYICTGFLATDPMRQQVVISSDWWADSSFRLSPLKAETVPLDGSPHYRGIRIAPGAVGQHDARPEQVTNKPPVSEKALRQWWFGEYLPASRGGGALPSRESDEAAAKAAFPGHQPPTRERIRALRSRPDTPTAGRGRPGKRLPI